MSNIALELENIHSNMQYILEPNLIVYIWPQLIYSDQSN